MHWFMIGLAVGLVANSARSHIVVAEKDCRVLGAYYGLDAAKEAAPNADHYIPVTVTK